MSQNGKGSAPRSCFSQQYRDNFDHIFMKKKDLGDDWGKRQAYRLVQDDDGHWYIIRADELAIFNHWEEAMNGRRHMPANFEPKAIDGPHNLRFCDYWEET